MRRIFSWMGIAGIVPLLLLLGGCGWEPLIPNPGPTDNGGGVPPPAGLQVRIVFECAACLQPSGGAASMTYTFRAEVTLPDPEAERVLIYSWNFGDGTDDEGQQVSHTFERPGTYQVRLRVITSTGAEGRDKIELVVQEAPQPELKVQRDIEEGELCSFERVLPQKIRVGERFTVQVTLKAKQDVQIVSWEDNIWFPQFHLLHEPSGVWIGMKAGESKVLLYEAKTLQAPEAENSWMSGVLSCNAGGYGNSEVLTLKSQLNIGEEEGP